MGDLRRDARLTFTGKINLTWADESGNPFACNGECIDVSATGLKIKLDFQIPLRTVVTVRARELSLHGSASVRSCVRGGTKYTLGLEFVGGMKWKLPEALAATNHG
jgi:PilZ domain